MIGPYLVNSQQRRIEAWGPACRIPFGTVTIDGRRFKVHRDTVPVWEIWETIRAKHGYKLDGNDTGFYNCRHIRHNPRLPWSSHAWATALDVNWLENPAGSKLVTDIPRAMIDELLSVHTESGAPVWMWGGDWDRDGSSLDHNYIDAMHWETIAHPKDLATGFVINGNQIVREDSNMDGLKPGDRGNAVQALQVALNDWRPTLALTLDKIYGNATKAAVAEYQQAANLPVDGIADDTTLFFILTNPLRNPETARRLAERLTS